jgi:archaemetzincin
MEKALSPQGKGVKLLLAFVSMMVLGATPLAAAPAPLRVVLVPCGPAPAAVLDFMGDGLRRELGAEVVQGEMAAVPVAAFVRRRRQYRAEPFLPLLALRRQAAGDLVLGVTGVDLYVPKLHFVFGLADPRQKCALISLARLDPAFYGQRPDPRVFEERALKEAIHELGHLLGLSHCPNPACIMFFSNRLSDTDRKGPGFCPACRRSLKR